MARLWSCDPKHTVSCLEDTTVVVDHLASPAVECPRMCAGVGDLETARLPTGAEVVVVQEPVAVAAGMLVVSKARKQQRPSQSNRIGVAKPVHARGLLPGKTAVSR